MPPWEKYAAQPEPPQPASGPWAKYSEPVRKNPGTILPFSQDAGGNLQFDSDAGLLGVVKRAVTLPGDVYTGKAPPKGPAIQERVIDLAATISPAAAPLRAGEHAIPGILRTFRKTEPAAPTVDALRQAGVASLDRAADMGVEYSAASIKSMAEATKQALNDKGFIGRVAPEVHGILDDLSKPPPDAIGTVKGLVAARRALQEAAGNFNNPREQKAAADAIEELDRFIAGSDPQGVMAGTPAAAGAALEESRGNFAAGFRSDRLTGAADRASLNAAVANSGHNVDNQIRQRLRDILVRPKEARGFSDQELARIEKIARGTLGANTARRVGNLLGGGGGLGQMLSGAVGAAGGAAVDPSAAAVGAVALPMLGHTSRSIANMLTRKQVDTLDEAIRKRSPLYEKMKQGAPFEVNSPETRAALARALLLYDAQQQ